MRKTLRKFAGLLVVGVAALLLQIPGYAQVDKKKKSTGKTAAAKKPGLPLKTTRKIEFSTDEGTWMSVDLSPDGKTLIFDLLGDFYTLPISGGTAKPVMTGLPFDSQPKYSPDGKMLTFVSDRSGSNNLWISNADGTKAKQLSKEQQAEFVSPVWTPDGDYVIVTKSSPATRGSAELWMYHKLGGTGLKISKGRSAPAGPPRPGPSSYGAFPTRDRKYIYYARQSPRTGFSLGIRNCQIIRRNLSNGDEDSITFTPGNAFRPVVSPDGQTLVFGTRYEGKTGLRLRSLVNGEERWLRYPINRDEQESRPTRDILPGYVFTGDGKELLLSFGGKIRRLDIATGRDQVIPFTAKVSLDAGPALYVDKKLENGPVKARLAQEPKISPDGKKVAFSALTALYSMDLTSRKPVRLTKVENPREYQPSWSPDGKWIAYVTWSTEGGHIWKIRSDGSGTPEKLTETPAFYRDPVWSPDGSRLVALRTSRLTRVNHPSDFLGPQPGLDIVSLRSAGGGMRTIIPARGFGKPHFSRDPRRIYVYGRQGLTSFRFDGTDRRTHFKVVGKGRGTRPAPARDVRVSSDGKWALALVNTQLYYFPVPHAGGNTPTINVSRAAVPTKKLTTIGADSFAWADRGRTVTWTVGASLFRLATSKITFDPPKKPAKKGDKNSTEKKSADSKKKEAKKTDKKKPLAEEIAINVTRPRHVPRGVIALRGAKVVTMKGSEIISKADILVKDNRIQAIGRSGTITIPPGTRVLDLNGKTIIPGLIDVHAHWEVRHSVLDTEDYTFWANLAYGVTTGRDPQTNTNDTFAYQDLVDTGDMIGPRIFTTGPGIFSTSNFQSYEQARDTVARYQKHYRAETLKAYLVGNRKQRQWVARASKELGIIPTTEGGSNFKLNLTHAVDGFAGNEHALPIAPIYNDVAQLYAKSGITYTPTLLVTYGGPSAKFYFFEKGNVYRDAKLQRFNPQAVLDGKTARIPWYRDSEYHFPEIARGANMILKAGGRIGVGGHGELQGLQCHWEMWGLAMGGMTNHDVLRVGTILGAEAIGYGKYLGSLEKGKMADLVILDKDPLLDIKNTNTVRYVMKNGELFEGDTLNQIHPVKKTLPTPWWWKDKPAPTKIARK